MQIAKLITVLLYSGLTAAAACNADNCARAVTGTFRGLPVAASRRNDCSSFFRITVTPATLTITQSRTTTPSTKTQTITVATVTTTASTATTFTTSTSTETNSDTVLSTDIETSFSTLTTAPALMRRGAGATTIRPSRIPAHASPCSGTSKYSSACSCAGVSLFTSTAVAPSTTETLVFTATGSATTQATSIILATFTSTVIITELSATRVTETLITTTTTTSVDATVTVSPFLVTLYRDASQSGPAVDIMDNFDTCITLTDATLNNEASSIAYREASRCTIYKDAGCSGESVDISRGDISEIFFGFIGDFNDVVSSLKCFA